MAEAPTGFQFGPALTPDGTRFSLWAPDAHAVSLVLEDRTQPLRRDARGFFTGESPGVGGGARYAFRIDEDLVVPDPASRCQPEGPHGPSVVTDPERYVWKNPDWRNRPWEDAVIMETHIGSATETGTYEALAAHLSAWRDTGITAVELMPLAAFAGTRNWGYDGVLPYAPAASYGTPDDLKSLIDHAHGLGLMVILDVVYNHFGPSGNYLHRYARRFFTERHRTPWGASINWDDADCEIVRAFFIQNALYWLEEFRFDGLRLDAVHAIRDDGATHVLSALARAVRQRIARPVHLVLENEANESRWLARDPEGRAPLYTAQWADDIHNAWHVLLTDEQEGYYAAYADTPLAHLTRALAEGFAYQGGASVLHDGAPRGEPSAHLPPTAFVSFLQNHDQIGNRAHGERLTGLAAPDRLALAQALLLLAPQIPLLFQGEDWGTAQPFLYFVDYNDEPDLAAAVREGRQREFSRFKQFGGHPESLPDPNAIEALRRSTLDWSEAEKPGHAAHRARIRALLDLRRAHILPLLRSIYRGSSHCTPAPDALDIAWRFDTGTLELIANFGSDELVLPQPTRGAPIWSSPGAAQGPDGLHLPPWSAQMRIATDER